MTGKDRQGTRRSGERDASLDTGPDSGRDSGLDTGLDTGGFLRPDPMVLAEEALIPGHNLVHPPPTRFTHELTADEPYRYDRPKAGAGEPDGVLPAGTPVVLMVDGRERSRVVDGQGRYIDVRTASLREL